MVSRSFINPLMPSSDVSHDAYRFHRSMDQDSNLLRPKNIAKVEPYSINNNTFRPLYSTGTPTQSSSMTINSNNKLVSGETNKARISSKHNEPTSIHISATSMPSMIRHSNVLQSDFLIPNPAFLSKHSPLSLSSASPPAVLVSQSLSKSSSQTAPQMLVSKSLEHGQSHQLLANDTLLHNDNNNNHHRTIQPESTENARQTHRSLKKMDLINSLVRMTAKKQIF